MIVPLYSFEKIYASSFHDEKYLVSITILIGMGGLFSIINYIIHLSKEIKKIKIGVEIVVIHVFIVLLNVLFITGATILLLLFRVFDDGFLNNGI